MIWTEGLDNLKIFIDYINNIHPTQLHLPARTLLLTYLSLMLMSL